MSLLWLNPALLAFTALVAVPLLAHLFAKARPKVLPFPSVQWLKQVERKTTNLRKPKDWLLLVLRTLAVAALVGAFLQPLLFSGPRLAAVNERKTMVLVVDRSASMSFVENGQSRLARGCGLADGILKSAGSQTLANVIWIDARPTPVFADPGVNVEALREAVQRTAATFDPGDVDAALRAAMEQLGRGEGARELYLISDFQASSWKQAALSVPPNVKLYKLGTAVTPAANASLTSMVVQPERPVAGTEARVLCRVQNFSPGELKTVVQLAFGEVRQSRPVTLPAWGEAVADFRVRCGAAGLQSITATLPEDAFPADDRRFGVVEVRESWRVAMEGPEKDASLQLWQRALGALGWLEMKAGAQPADVVVAVRAQPTRASDLRAAAEHGAMVICQPGEDWSGTPWMAFWGGDAKGAALQQEQHDPQKDKPWTMQALQDKHPLWQVFSSGEYGDPAGGHAWRRLRLVAEEAMSLMRYTDGVPAVAVQHVGKGWLVLWNVELDEAASDCVQQPAFLVLLGEMLLRHGEGGGTGQDRSFGPSQPIVWQPGQPVGQDQVHLLDDAGADVALAAEPGSRSPLLRSAKALPPGAYKWLVDGQLTERAAVNFPADVESDLRCLNPDALNAGESLSLDAAASLVAQRDGLPLWPWCVAAGLLLLCLEGLLAKTTGAAGGTSIASAS